MLIDEGDGADEANQVLCACCSQGSRRLSQKLSVIWYNSDEKVEACGRKLGVKWGFDALLCFDVFSGCFSWPKLDCVSAARISGSRDHGGYF